MKILVSACLLGDNVKYNGGNNKSSSVLNFIKGHEVMSFCPEILAGFSVPRKAIEMKGEDLISVDGENLNEYMTLSLSRIDKIIKDFKPDLAILKSRSPSCGKDKIYDGSFTHTLTDKDGYASKYLKDNNIKVISEEDI